MALVSIIIPVKNEPYLEKTIEDIKVKARGEIEICIARDEGEGCHMRQAINGAVESAKGDYLLKLDAHCLLDEGFDLKLIEAHQPNWVQIPRRYRLDAEKWEIIEDGREPVDYEFILFPHLVSPVGDSPGFIWGMTWEDRTKERKEIKIDDIMHFQGSCWFMTKEWFKKCGFLDTQYGGFAQESEEILFTTLTHGGRVVVNKNTYYAHLHKTAKEREWFTVPTGELAQGAAYSYNLWVKDKEFFSTFIKDFMPIPTWPLAWEKVLYG